MKRLTENIGDFAYTYSGTQKTNKEYDKWVFEATCKLGKLEDIFELIEKMSKKPVCWKDDDGEEWLDYYTYSTILYNPKTNEIEIYGYEFITSYKVDEYGLTWWFKEDKSE